MSASSPPVGRRSLVSATVVAAIAGCLSTETDDDDTPEQNASSAGTETIGETDSKPESAPSDRDERARTDVPEHDDSEADIVGHTLRRLINADDRATVAEELSIEYDEGLVDVLIRLESADVAPPAEYIHTTLFQDRDRLSATVHLDDVDELADHETVGFVQLSPQPDEETARR